MNQTRRLAAILAADVAGYSRLMGADEEGTHERLKAHLRELVDPKIEELAAQRFQTLERTLLIRPHQPGIPRHIGGEDRGETAGLAHSAAPVASRRPDRYSSCCSGFRR